MISHAQCAGKRSTVVVIDSAFIRGSCQFERNTFTTALSISPFSLSSVLKIVPPPSDNTPLRGPDGCLFEKRVRVRVGVGVGVGVGRRRRRRVMRQRADATADGTNYMRARYSIPGTIPRKLTRDYHADRPIRIRTGGWEVVFFKPRWSEVHRFIYGLIFRFGTMNAKKSAWAGPRE